MIITYVWNLKKDTKSIYLQNRNRLMHRKKHGYQSGKGRDKSGVWY